MCKTYSFISSGIFKIKDTPQKLAREQPAPTELTDAAIQNKNQAKIKQSNQRLKKNIR